MTLALIIGMAAYAVGAILIAGRGIINKLVYKLGLWRGDS